MAIFDPKIVIFDPKTWTKVFKNIFILTAPKNCPSKHCIIHFALIFVNLFYQWPFLTQKQQFLTPKWSFLTQKQEQKFLKIFSSRRHWKTVLVNIVSSILPSFLSTFSTNGHFWPKHSNFWPQNGHFWPKNKKKSFLKYFHLDGTKKLS